MTSEQKKSLSEAAKELRKAMKGVGTDEAAIVKAIVGFSNADLQQLIEVYRKEISRDLIPDLKSECGGNFLKVLLAMFTAWDTYDSHCVHEAIAGLGTNEKLLTEIICTRTPDELKAIAKRYEGEYQKSMVDAIKSDTSGDYQKLLLACFTDSRKGGLNSGKVSKDIEALYQAGEGKMGTDENTFVQLIGSQPRAHVEAVALEYGMKHGKHFSEVVKSELSGPVKYALQVLTTPLAQFWAGQFSAAMKGLGTNDDMLIRTLCSTYHRCLREVTVEYLKMYKTNLKQAFADEASGDYKKLLVAIATHYTVAQG